MTGFFNGQRLDEESEEEEEEQTADVWSVAWSLHAWT